MENIWASSTYYLTQILKFRTGLEIPYCWIIQFPKVSVSLVLGVITGSTDYNLSSRLTREREKKQGKQVQGEVTYKQSPCPWCKHSRPLPYYDPDKQDYQIKVIQGPVSRSCFMTELAIKHNLAHISVLNYEREFHVIFEMLRDLFYFPHCCWLYGLSS